MHTAAQGELFPRDKAMQPELLLRYLLLRTSGRFPMVTLSSGHWQLASERFHPWGFDSIGEVRLEALIAAIEAGRGPEWITAEPWPVFATTHIALRIALGGRKPVAAAMSFEVYRVA